MTKILSYVNFALIILPLSAGMVAAFSITFLKAATIAYKEYGFNNPSVYIYIMVALFSGQLELYTMNRAMNLFE